MVSIFQRTTVHQRYKAKALALFTILAGLSVSFTTPTYAAVICPTSDACQIGDAVGIIENIIKYLARAPAIAFLIMTIVAGFQFVTSGGDPKAAASARTTLTYAIIGIVLVIASWLILLVIKSVTGVNVTNVQIPP